jgi:hypothetical protein
MSRHNHLNCSALTTLILLLFAVRSLAQSPLPTSRTVDWTHVGIPGGIPSANWPVYKTLSPSGGSDDSVAIQNAINSAPAGSVVVLNPGTYTLHRSSIVCQGKSDDFGGGVYEAGLCLTDKSVVLRGSGPDKTVLNYGDGANIISLGRTYLNGTNATYININSGASKGSTQITLASVSGLAGGSYLGITQTNPNDSDGNPLVDANGYNGCSYCGHNQPNKAMIQIDRITGISGNTVTLERPLYFDYTNAPQAFNIPMVENIGLENLRVVGAVSSGTGIVYKNINLEGCAHCWVTNVESDMAVDRANIYLSDVYGSEISNNYLNDSYSHNSGENYSIFLEFRASENLIQNNIIRKARHSVVMAGTSGNVIAYNYMIDPYMGEDNNSLPDGRTHGAHPFMNLWEGNIRPNEEQDFVHGSASHNTFFRNYYNLTSTNPSTGSPMTSGIFAVNLAYDNNYMNVLGNVIGQYPSGCTATSYQDNADGPQNRAIYKLGYFDDGGSTSGTAALKAKVENTILRGGNWDCKTNSVVWSSNVPSGSLASTYLAQQTLPTSLYLSSKPAWFAATNAVWPPIDPAASAKVNKNPAQICYESGPKNGGAFTPSACYATVASSTRPQPPTNLSAVVN